MPGFGAYAVGEYGEFDFSFQDTDIAVDITYSSHDLPFLMNALADTSGLDEVVAANRYAGTTGLDEVVALNTKAGTTTLSVSGALSSIAGITPTDAVTAAERILYGTVLYPDRPTLTVATAGTQALTLTWTDVVHAEAYHVYRGTTSTNLSGIAIVSPSTSTYADTGLTNGTTYYYQVGAYYQGYETLSAVVSGVPVAWTPASISGVVDGWDFADTSKIALFPSTSLISTVTGQLGVHTLAAGSNAPSSGTTINGLNVATFSKTPGTDLVKSGVSISSPVTVLFVAKPTAATVAASNAQLLSNNTDPEDTCYAVSGVWTAYNGTNASTGAAVDTNTHQHVVLFNGASSQWWIDGTSVWSGVLGSAGRTTIDIGGVGSSSGYDGALGELWLVAGAISAGDRTNWNSYCARWGL